MGYSMEELSIIGKIDNLYSMYYEAGVKGDILESIYEELGYGDEEKRLYRAFCKESYLKSLK